MHLDGHGLWYRPEPSPQRKPGERRLSSRLDREELHSGNIEWSGGELSAASSEPDGAQLRMDI